MDETRRSGFGRKNWWKLGIYSFRVRILSGFLLVSLTTLSIAGLAYWYQVNATKLARLNSLVADMRLEVVGLQKAEAEFNSQALTAPSFFHDGVHPTATAHTLGFESINQRITELEQRLPEAMSPTTTDSLRGLLTHMRATLLALRKDFMAYVVGIRKRGFWGYGLLGEMRGLAHNLESSQRLDRADVLQLRRHEKDYLLRRDTSYYVQAKTLAESLRIMMVATHTAQAEANGLDTYLKKFAEVVALEAELGLNGQGLRSTIHAHSTQLAEEVDMLNAVLAQEASTLGVRYRQRILLLVVLALLMTLGMSIYFAVRLSRPIRQITTYMTHELASHFQGPSQTLNLGSKDELAQLGEDVALMVAQIRKQIEEINARNHALVEVNATLEQTKEKQAALLRVREMVHSIISHDLRAPMTGMIGYLQATLEESNELFGGQAQKFLRKMLANVKRLNELMENLLRWSLFQSGEMIWEPAPLDLNDAVTRNLALYAEMAEAKEIRLLSDLDRPWTVHADAQMLDFILRNLVTNAIKFSRPGGQVRITTEAFPNDLVRISVIDQGVGMSQDKIDRILVHGEHYTSSGTQKEKGTGFGLMLCRDFVARHGGKLMMESTVGEGTRVSFTLQMPVVN
jgi:signal transduction histidine kinase